MSKGGGGSGKSVAGRGGGANGRSKGGGGAAATNNSPVNNEPTTAPKQSSLEKAFAESKNVGEVLDMRQLSMLAKEKGITPDDKRSKQSYIDALKKVIKPPTKELSAEDKEIAKFFDQKDKSRVASQNKRDAKKAAEKAAKASTKVSATVSKTERISALGRANRAEAAIGKELQGIYAKKSQNIVAMREARATNNQTELAKLQQEQRKLVSREARVTIRSTKVRRMKSRIEDPE